MEAERRMDSACGERRHLRRFSRGSTERPTPWYYPPPSLPLIFSAQLHSTLLSDVSPGRRAVDFLWRLRVPVGLNLP